MHEFLVGTKQTWRDVCYECAPAKAALSSGCKPHPGNRSQPEAIGAVMEVTKWLKPSISVSRIGGGASVQAATQSEDEQSSKRTMSRSTRQPSLGKTDTSVE